MSPFAVEATFPPSLQDNPILALISVMSFWALFLLCLQWIWSILDDARERPAPNGSYLRLARRVRLYILGSALAVAVPRLIQLMLWQVMSENAREIVSSITWLACAPAAALLMLAWWTDNRVVATERAYTAANGPYPAPEQAPREKKRGAIILGLIFVIAFATTYVRPRPDVPASPVVERIER